MNTGKRFENNFKSSIPKDVFYYRLKDSSNIWGSNDRIRYTPSNICDCIVFNGDYLFLFELKSTKGKNLPFTNIRKHQIDELLEGTNYSNIIAGFIIFFSDLDKCYFIEISEFEDFYSKTNRKSLPINYFDNHGIEIECSKKKINCTYNIDKFLKDTVIYV